MKISLENFDLDFFNSLSEKDKIGYKPENSYYHTIIYDNQKVGIIGFIHHRLTKEKFLQIIIKPEFKRKGIFRESLNILFKKYKIKKLNATIDKTNTDSINAHTKIGFIRLPDKIEREYREFRSLSRSQIRFVIFDKDYQMISFPDNEIKQYIARLSHSKTCSTTRVSKERDKYELYKLYITNWYDVVKIIFIKTFTDINDHPYKNELTKDQIKEISKYGKFDVIKFIKVE